MKVGDLVNWTAADVPVMGLVVETDTKPNDIAPIHRVIIGSLEIFVYASSLEIISESR
tara:strand:- start:1962 stop:2135 length:174 start_codon:yes stop_codon:yes gene_type:complete